MQPLETQTLKASPYQTQTAVDTVLPDRLPSTPSSQTVSDYAITWMCDAEARALGKLTGKEKHKPYRVVIGELRIRVHPETLVPYASKHLDLLLKTFKPIDPPDSSYVTYIRTCGASMSGKVFTKEGGMDLGGLSRHFWYHLLPNIALETQDEHPLLTQTSEGYYTLSAEMGRPLSIQQGRLCENIGKLLCAFASGLNQETQVKLGPTFPHHFFAGLLHLYGKYYGESSSAKPPFSFHEMLPYDQKEMCFVFAREKKNGMRDQKGVLLFDLPPTNKLELSHYDTTTLYKIWRLMNLQASEESLQIRFPDMHAFIDPSESAIIEDKDLEKFAQTFRKNLEAIKDNENFVQDAVMQHAYDIYHLQCEALVAVMQGFGQVSPKAIEPFLTIYLRNSLSSASQKLSSAIQSPLFTPAAFLEFLKRSKTKETLLDVKIEWIKEWYSTQATAKQMKKLLRCMHGAEVIPIKLAPCFKLSLGKYSVFHTCDASVNLGKELMEEKNAQEFIQKWRTHIRLALASNFDKK